MTGQGDSYRLPDPELRAYDRGVGSLSVDGDWWTVRELDAGKLVHHAIPAVTARFLHPDHAAVLAAGSRFSAWWGLNGNSTADLGDSDSSVGGA